MKHLTQQTGFSLIELMITLTIVSILTAMSVVSYQAIHHKLALQQAKQSLYHAAKTYHFYQLVNPYLLNDLNANILFENNNDYHFQIEENNSNTTFIAIKKHMNSHDSCTKLTLNTVDETQAFDSNDQPNQSCWQ